MLEYNMDLYSDSQFQIITPDDNARSFNYYVTEYGRFRAGNRYYTKRDGKQAALMMFTISGAGELEWNSQTCRLTPGTAVVINCDTYHHYRTASAEPWDFFWVHFDSTYPDCYLNMLTQQLSPLLLTDAPAMHTCFENLKSAAQLDGILSWAELSHTISEMLMLMLRTLLNERSIPHQRRSEIERLADYIRANSAEKLSMDDFMNIANLSKYHLIRLFRQQMGIPPYDYMHHCRINHAQQLLRTTDMTVLEIARQTGYSDSVSFIRHFKKIVGTTPSRYSSESIQLPSIEK